MRESETRILVIEDDEPTLEAITLILELEGYEVYSQKNTESVFQILNNEFINLIIIDALLGPEDGRDMAKQIKLSEFHHIPIILMSALDASKHAKFEKNWNDFIGKPFDMEVMLAKISQQLMC